MTELNDLWFDFRENVKRQKEYLKLCGFDTDFDIEQALTTGKAFCTIGGTIFQLQKFVLSDGSIMLVGVFEEWGLDTFYCMDGVCFADGETIGDGDVLLINHQDYEWFQIYRTAEGILRAGGPYAALDAIESIEEKSLDIMATRKGVHDTISVLVAAEYASKFLNKF